MSSWVRRISGKDDDDARLLLLLSLNPSLSLSLSLPLILAIIPALHFYPPFLINHPSPNNSPQSYLLYHLLYLTFLINHPFIFCFNIDWIVDQLHS